MALIFFSHPTWHGGYAPGRQCCQALLSKRNLPRTQWSRDKGALRKKVSASSKPLATRTGTMTTSSHAAMPQTMEAPKWSGNDKMPDYMWMPNAFLAGLACLFGGVHVFPSTTAPNVSLMMSNTDDPRNNPPMDTNTHDHPEQVKFQEIKDPDVHVNENTTTDLNEELSRECFAGSVASVKALVEKGADPNFRHKDTDGDTLLHRAVLGRNVNVVRYLLEQGLVQDVNAPNFKGWNPLHLAVYSNKFEIVRLLLEHGANPVSFTGDSRYTPLHIACRYKRIKILKYFLLQEGEPWGSKVDVNMPDTYGQTALQYALYNADAEAVQVLLEHGADTSKIGVLHFSAMGPMWREKAALIKAAKRRRRQAEAFQGVHGWRAFVEAVLDDIDIAVEERENDADANVETTQVLMQRKARILASQKELHEIDLKLQLAGYELPLKPLLHKKKKLEAELVLLCQSKDIQWQRRRHPRKAPTVFISHTGKDEISAAFSEVLWESLRKRHGIDTFLDSESIKTGDAWAQEIEFCATGCNVFVCILSDAYFQRYWCMHELDLALQSGRYIIPVCFDKEYKIPDASDTTRKVLADEIVRKHGKSDEQRLERWCDNLMKLKQIQGLRNNFVAKHSFLMFRDNVVYALLKYLKREESE